MSLPMPSSSSSSSRSSSSTAFFLPGEDLRMMVVVMRFSAGFFSTGFFSTTGFSISARSFLSGCGDTCSATLAAKLLVVVGTAKSLRLSIS
jgi:hypothetical protein